MIRLFIVAPPVLALAAGFTVAAGSADEFDRFARSGIEKWKKVALVANVRTD